MRAAAHIGCEMGMLSTAAASRQAALLGEFGLPTAWRADPADVAGRLSLDKKRAGARQRWVLADRIGAGRVRDDVPDDLVRDAIALVTGG
jgi:3-dehydroquinate synthetase